MFLRAAFTLTTKWFVDDDVLPLNYQAVTPSWDLNPHLRLHPNFLEVPFHTFDKSHR